MKEEIIARWVEKGEEDLKAASYLLASPEPPLSVIAFHCQQAVEKYLKAYLTAQEVRIPKTHDLAFLLELCLEKDRDFAFLNQEQVAALTFYAVAIRYPDASYVPSLEEVREAYETARAVGRFVLEKLEKG